MKVLPGAPSPLGATWDTRGVNFALYSENATGVELCLLDDAGQETRVPLQHKTAFVWHSYVEGLAPGQRYGYRVSGPYEPQRGLRFNDRNLLLDPYAKAVDRVESWDEGLFAYELGHPDGDLARSERDATGVPHGLVIDPRFDWGDDAPPAIPFNRSIVYEAHVRGLTMKHPQVPPELRGKYAGIASEPILRHLTSLGVTAIELLPVHSFIDDKMLLDRGLRNYWGYNTLNFFAPDVRYRTQDVPGSSLREFKEMVRALHRAGIEVILDVVYNHTAEGNHLGPTLSFKGIDNPTYYRLSAGDPRYYHDYTGTGNSLNVRHPQTLRLIMDSLRYWIEEMHVDGFRFDLAATLARGLYDVDQLSSFFTIIHQDPVINRAKLIAEPWDVGDGGYQVGNFPVGWAEWNGKYRDSIRAFWRGVGGSAGDLAHRLSGSSDLYQSSGRAPSASVNFVVAHDGFTLRDLVSYNDKHNEANGEDNRDGTSDNLAWSCGAEGPSEDAEVLRLRARQQRNLMATVLLSQGTPMICAGDEMGRTQQGNNNAYCQDNETSWLDWSPLLEAAPYGAPDPRRALFDFTRRLIAVRHEHPALRRSKFFQGRPVPGIGDRDLAWLRHDGVEMSDADWANPYTSSLAMVLSGLAVDAVDEGGAPVVDDDLVLMINGSDAVLDFRLPALKSEARWELLVSTGDDAAREDVAPGEQTRLGGRELKLFRLPRREDASMRKPTSTYRLQLQAGFGFAEARGLVDYLDALGISHVYASPYLKAEVGSTHGYNLADPTMLSPEIGTEAELVAWTDALRARGMGHIVDVVPNHMGIRTGENAWWSDVLENGRCSRFADYFDIDWAPPKEGLRGRVLLPILGAPYGDVLERGELSLRREGGAFFVGYYERRLPVSPPTLAPLLERARARLTLPKDDLAVQELQSIVNALLHLPSSDEHAEERREERGREKEIVKRRLDALCGTSSEVREAIDAAVTEINGQPGDPRSFDALDALLREQCYRLSFWRVATEEINYRRFFEVNDLAAVRMERDAVFEHAHALLFRLIGEGRLDGLRLDHTDGLQDPAQYFAKLQARAVKARRLGGAAPDPAATAADASLPRTSVLSGSLDGGKPLFVVAEKILAPGERLPPDFAIHGTTGYEFGALVDGLWVDKSSEAALTATYQLATGDQASFAEHVLAGKRAIMSLSLSSEVTTLARALSRIAEEDRRSRDFTLGSLTTAILETIAHFQVYRTYLRADGTRGPEDEAHIGRATRLARRKNRELNASVFDFLRDVLLLRPKEDEPPETRAARVAFALRFQQLTGPVMAKGLEDTAFYTYPRLVSLNEVGSRPDRFGVSVAELHAENAARLRASPLGMTATSTHDSKRGEDARARISVISEIPDLWKEQVLAFRAVAERYRTEIDEELTPSGVDEYLFYQTALGAFPPDGELAGFPDRIAEYMIKAAREAKQRTSWINPNEAYEQALDGFARAMLGDPAFVDRLRALVERIAVHGATNGLAQTLLKIAAPGVPDFYQGSEVWNHALVDPDNRRPVDYDALRALLARVESTPVAALRDAFTDGGLKLHVVRAALRLRRQHPTLFLEGDYTPLDGGEHVVAFSRSEGARTVVCLTARQGARLTSAAPAWCIGAAWGERELELPPARELRCVLSGRTFAGGARARLADLFADLPVALLVSEASQ